MRHMRFPADQHAPTAGKLPILNRMQRLVILSLLAVLVSARAPADSHLTVTKEERLALISRAQVWKPTDVANMDLRNGPDGVGAFQPNQLLTCDYTPRPPDGSSRKFYCALPDGDVI